MDTENYPQHREDFEVVLIKDGVNPLFAKSGDFLRVAVTSSSPLAAQMSDVVKAEEKKGFHAMFAAKPGVFTDPEIQARHREIDTGSIDRTKI